MPTRFSQTTNVTNGTLDLVLCLAGMYSTAAFKWAWTKFSYSSFGVCVSAFPRSASYLFLSANAYFSNISVIKLGLVIVFGGRCSGRILW